MCVIGQIICRVRAIKGLFDCNRYGFFPSTITHLVLRLAAQWRNRRAYRDSGESKTRRAKNAARGTGSRGGRSSSACHCEPTVLLWRILCPGARPSRHSRGNVSEVRRTCHTRGLRGAKRGGGRVVHIFTRRSPVGAGDDGEDVGKGGGEGRRLLGGGYWAEAIG